MNTTTTNNSRVGKELVRQMTFEKRAPDNTFIRGTGIDKPLDILNVNASPATISGDECWAIWLPAGKELALRSRSEHTEASEQPEWPDAHLVALPEGSMLSGEQWGEEFEARMSRLPKTANKIAVIPVRGVITQRNPFEGTTTERLGRQLSAAVADPEVGVVVFDIDSPGGAVLGTPELGEAIRSADEQKPMVAVANSMAASGAYWLASAARRLAVAPSGQVGSIGVFSMHVDRSKMLDDMGIDVTFIHAGKFKVEGNPTEPLGDEAKAAMQGRIDTYYDMFVGAVAAGRGVTKGEVTANFGQGRMFTAEAAKALGMVDRVATLEGVLAGMMKSGNGTKATGKSLDTAERRLRLSGSSP